MSQADRQYWDQRWTEVGSAPIFDESPDPPGFADLVGLFPTVGRALDVACGRGRGSAWLAQRGLDVLGLDISPVAVDLARRYVEAMGVADRCEFAVVDLDHGLPSGRRVDLVFSYLYWTPELTRPMVDRLAEGGIVAVCHVSEAGVGPGEWRIPVGKLTRAFEEVDGLDILDDREADGMARIVARRSNP
jgi:SAM-dependent methyltransferase